MSQRIRPLSVPTSIIGPLPGIGKWITSVNEASTSSNISVSSGIGIASPKTGLPDPKVGSEIVILQALEPMPSNIKSKSPLPVSNFSITPILPTTESVRVSIFGKPFSRINE